MQLKEFIIVNHDQLFALDFEFYKWASTNIKILYCILPIILVERLDCSLKNNAEK